MCVRHTPPITHPEFSLKLGPRAGHFVLIAATFLFALPMILVGVAEGAQGFTATSTVTVRGGRIEVPDPEPAVVEPENDPELGVPAQPAPPPQGEVPGHQPTEPVQPSPKPTEPTTPAIEIPGLPLNPPADEDPEPAPDEPAGP